MVGHPKIIDALENRDHDKAFEALKEHLWSVEKIDLGGMARNKPDTGEKAVR